MGDLEEIYKFGTFAIWPPDEIREVVNGLRKKYDPVSQEICEAHITLTQPFVIEPNDDAFNKISEVVKKFAQFEIVLGPVERFDSSTVIKLDVQPSEKILELRNELHNLGFFNTKLPHTKDFIPHMTISEGGVKENEEINKVVDLLGKKLKKMEFKCTKISYICPDENFSFKVKKNINLGA